MELSHLSHFFKKYAHLVPSDMVVRDTLIPILKEKYGIDIEREAFSIVRGVVSISAHPAHQTVIRMHAQELEAALLAALKQKTLLIS
jgi:hypothetical protein